MLSLLYIFYIEDNCLFYGFLMKSVGFPQLLSKKNNNNRRALRLITNTVAYAKFSSIYFNYVRALASQFWFILERKDDMSLSSNFVQTNSELVKS